MRKFLFITIMLLMGVIVGKAQASSWNYVGDNYSGTEHVVLVGLVDASGNALTFGANDQVWLGAFLGDECRGQVLATTQSNIWYFPMRIKGSASDNGTAVSFRLYKDDVEYVLSGEKTLTYANETTANFPSQLFKLTFVQPTGYSFPDQLTVDVNKTVNLLEQFKWAPENATVPVFSWDFSNSQQYINVENNVLTGKAPIKVTYLGIQGLGEIQNLDNQSWVDVYVRQPITSITLKDEYADMMSVYVNDTQALTAIMSNCYTVTPADANEDLVWSWEPENAFTESVVEGQKQWTPNTAGRYKLTLIGGSESTVLALQVMNRVESMQATVETIHLFVGDELTPLLPYAYTFVPNQYVNTDVKVSISQGDAAPLSQDETTGAITATAVGNAFVYVNSAENENAKVTLFVEVHPNITGVNVKSETLAVEFGSNGDVNITEQFFANFSFTPDATYVPVYREVESADSEVCSVSYDGQTSTWTVLAKKVGTSNITISHNATRTTLVDGELIDNTVSAASKFIVSVVQGLTGFTFDDVVLGFGEVGKLGLRPTPLTASAEASKIKVEIRVNANFSQWDLARAQVGDESYGLDWLIYPQAVGNGQINVYYDGVLFGTGSISISQTFEQKGGWAWVTPFGGSVNDLNSIYGSALQEMRSQTELLFNDPVYGYFGDLESMQPMKGYKVCIKDGEYVNASNSIVEYEPLKPNYIRFASKWNWIGTPYQFSQSIADALKSDDFSAGDRIVSKDNGFAEYDGTKWTGNLTTLTPGEGYLLYNSSDSYISVEMVAEAELGKPSQANAIIGREMPCNVWQYDATQFSDNMTIVADLGEDFADERYSIGAYIGDECRGEGDFVDGKWFITVHGDAASNGKNVSFRLYDSMTDEIHEIESVQAYGQMAGSLRAPVNMKVSPVASGLESISSDVIDADAKYFTIDGVEVANPTSGLYILVKGNTVRKVYVK